MEVTHTQDEPATLGVAEAAELAHMSKDTIRRYSDSGVLRTFRTPGNQRRFRPSDVRQLLTPSASAVSSPNEAAGVPEAVAS